MTGRMGWTGQVRHVVRFDLRRLRWMMLGFAALMAAIVLQVILRFPAAAEAGTGGPSLRFGAFALGLVLGILLIHQGPPDRRDAFWARLPLSPAAVLAAKLLVASVLLVGLPLAGQIGLFVWTGVPVREALSLMWLAVAPWSAWILAALLIGSVFRTIGGAILAGVLIPVLGPMLVSAVFFVLLSTTNAEFAMEVYPATWVMGSVVGAFIAGIVMLRFLYRSGGIGAGARVAASALAAGLAFFAILVMDGASASPAASLPEVAPPVAVLHAQRIQPRVRTGAAPGVRITTELEVFDVLLDGRTYRLVPTGLTLRDPRGGEHVLALEWVHLGSEPLPDGAVPGSPAPAVGFQRGGLVLDALVTSRQMELLRAGGTSLVVDGRMELLEIRKLGSVALEAGGEVRGWGSRARLIPEPPGPGVREVAVELAHLGTGGSPMGPAPRVWERAFPLLFTTTDASGTVLRPALSGTSSGARAAHAAVFPWLPVHHTTGRLTIDYEPAGPGPSAGPAADSLHVFRRVPRGFAQVSLSVELPALLEPNP